MIEPTYSTAYERLVDANRSPGDEDLVGMLAYAFYKADKRELARSGDFSPEQLRQHYKTLTTGQIDLYRAAALRRLEQYAQLVVDQTRPQIEEETREAHLEVAKGEIISAVKASTSWRTIIAWNVVAWLITLAITFLVAVGFGNLTLTINPAN